MANLNEEARATVILNGQQANATLKEIEASARALNAELRKLKPNSEEFIQKSTQYQQVKKHLAEVRTEINGTASAMSKMADGANKYFQLFTMFAAGAVGVGMAIKGVVSGSADLSDALSDIQKTTGLSLSEVKLLSAELGRINTRTAKKELLDLAYIAGKLGYTSKADILGFVKAADQINVALAKDLGGNVEEAVNVLGKLTDIFKLKDKFGIEQALLKTGSAINALGAASTANEGYLVEFTKRLGGIAPQAGLSIENVLGIAATLDQLGQSAEMSATAVSQLIVRMFKNTSEYAKIAGLDVKTFSATLQTDANQALIMFLSGLSKNNGGLKELSEKFKDLGIDGSRAIGVIGALSNNIKMLKDSQSLSNEEFAKGTSLTEEFSIKNDNLAGSLEKVGKWFYKLVFNPTLTEALTGIVKTFAKWVEIPLSQTMEDERIKANALAMELSEANISAKDRNALYIELKTLAPQILEGIDKESIAYDKLSSNLAKYNDQMINKIILQKKDEAIADAQEEVARTREKRLNDDMALRQRLVKVVQKVKETPGQSVEANALEKIMLDAQSTLDQKWQKMVQYIEQHKILDEHLALQIKAQVINSNFAAWSSQEEKAMNTLDKLIQEKKDMENMLGSKIGPKTTSGSSSPPSGSGNPATSFSSTSSDGKSDEDAKRRAAYLLDIERQLIEARAQLQKAGLERDLAMEDAHLKEKLSKINGSTAKEVELKELLTKANEQRKQEISQKYADQEAELAYKTEKAAIEARIQSLKDTSPEYLQAVLEGLQLEMEYTLSNAKLTAEQKKLIEDSFALKGQTTIKKFDDKLDMQEVDFHEKLNQLKLRSDIDLAKGKEKIQLEVNEKYYSLLQENLDNEQRCGEIRLQMEQEIAQRQVELAQQTNQKLAEEAISLTNGLMDGINQVFSMQTQTENEELARDEAANNKKKENLKAQLDAKLISKSQYDSQVSKMDLEMDKKKRKLEHDQAVRNKELALFNALINVATAVASALTAGPGIGIALSIITAALGAIQVGYILSEKVPEAAKGRYSVIGREDNKLYKDVPYVGATETGLYSTPTLISETGQELVVDPRTTRNLMINYPHVIEAINFARVPQRTAGLYQEAPVSSTQQVTVQSPVSTEFIESINKLNSLLEGGIPAFISFEHLRDTTNQVNQIESDVKP